MAAIITVSDVFEFCGTDPGQVTKQTDAVTDLITRKQEQLQTTLRRSLEDASFSNRYIWNGKDCVIVREKCFLNGFLRDTYEITSLTEGSTSLTASTDYSDVYDYIYDSKTGIIHKKNGYWSTDIQAIKISGSYGYLTASQAARSDIKDILIEMVAAASGLWKTNYTTSQGNITQTKHTMTKTTMALIKKHINYGY